jgi:hypothetical protein
LLGIASGSLALLCVTGSISSKLSIASSVSSSITTCYCSGVVCVSSTDALMMLVGCNINTSRLSTYSTSIALCFALSFAFSSLSTSRCVSSIGISTSSTLSSSVEFIVNIYLRMTYSSGIASTSISSTCVSSLAFSLSTALYTSVSIPSQHQSEYSQQSPK